MKRGRPRKYPLDQPIDSHAPMIIPKPAANTSLLEAGLQMAQGLLQMYTESKLAIAAKYRACDKFKEGAEYRAMLSREIGHIEATERLIKEFEELLR